MSPYFIHQGWELYSTYWDVDSIIIICMRFPFDVVMAGSFQTAKGWGGSDNLLPWGPMEVPEKHRSTTARTQARKRTHRKCWWWRWGWWAARSPWLCWHGWWTGRWCPGEAVRRRGGSYSRAGTRSEGAGAAAPRGRKTGRCCSWSVFGDRTRHANTWPRTANMDILLNWDHALRLT